MKHDRRPGSAGPGTITESDLHDRAKETDPMSEHTTDRRRFLAYFSSIGLTTTLLPGALWARMQEQQATTVTPDMIRHAGAVAGFEITPDHAEEMAEGVNRNLAGYAELRRFALDNSVAPPIVFSPLVPGAPGMVGPPFAV